MPDLTLQLIFMRALALLIFTAVQGGTVAAAGVVLGDPGPRYDGRLTLSPLRHLDPIGAVGLILFGLGWSKPVAIDPSELRPGRSGLVLAVLAQTLALLAMAMALHLLTVPALEALPLSAGLLAAAFLRTAAALCLANALFALLPVPPLPGGQLLVALGIGVPERGVWLLGVALLVLAATGTVPAVLDPVESALAPLLIGGS